MITSRASTPATRPSTEPAAAAAIEAVGVHHAYGLRPALVDLSLTIASGELFAVLGPNGGGKTTLFRLLSTLIPVQRGSVHLLGHDLTLYGLRGRELTRRLDELLEQFALADRAHELTERLSGGLRRRVELAKGMIHQPRLLLLDEPSTGLDPAARSDLWRYLQYLKREQGTTVLLTTHYLDEADGADRIAILNEGRLVALGPPNELRSQVGGDSITIEVDQPEDLAAAIRDQLGLPARVIDEAVRLEVPEGHGWVSRIVETFPGRVKGIRLGQPTLEDVFIARTGHRFWREPKGD
jgi:ABC-2 type transport system ATP-binding protein